MMIELEFFCCEHKSFLKVLTKNFYSMFSDLRAKEEEAIRKAEVAARDQADAGTPSREEAGKLFIYLNLFMLK